MKVLGWFLICFEGREDMSCWQIWYRIWEKGFKDDAKEVAQGYECGVGLDRFNDIKEGDILEAFVMEEVTKD